MDFVTSLIVLSQLLLIIFDKTLSEDCVQQSACSCKTSQYTIDFSALAKGKNPRFSAPAGTDTSYSYEPCVASSDNCGQTGSTVAICQHQVGTHVVGEPSTANISGDVEKGSLRVTYTAVDVIRRTGVVSLICGTEEKFEFTEESPILQYNFKLTSPLLCIPGGSGSSTSSGLSTGSVLLIIFFVLVLVYFILGAVFLKFRRGAEGVEIIPNVEFWKSLPGLIRDGTLFVFRGCKTDSSYSQI